MQRPFDNRDNHAMKKQMHNSMPRKVKSRISSPFIKFSAMSLVLFAFGIKHAKADLFWNTSDTSETLTSSTWGTSSSGPFTNPWVNGSNIDFTAATDAITNVTNTPVGNINISAGATVTWTAAGTFSTGGLVSTVTIGSGGTLTWNAQAIATTTGTGFIMNGPGTWTIGSLATSAYTGGFTLNSGTVTVTGSAGVDSLGAGALNINGGTINSTGSKTYAPTSIVIGGNYTYTGTGTSTWGAAVNLGTAPVAVTLGNSSADTVSEVFTGVISGATGASLTVNGSGTGTITLMNTANTFSGGLIVNATEVDIAADGSLGTAPTSPTNDITVNGGRLSTVNGDNVAINADRNILLGSTAGTSIEAAGSTGVLVYNGVMQDLTTGGILVKQGAGVLELGGQNTYTGATSINNGKVQLETGGNLPSGTTVNMGQSSSTNLGTFDLNGISQQIAGLNSTTGTNANTMGTKNTVTSSTTAATLTISGSGSYFYGAGTTQNSGVITGPISLVMQGAGTQTLGDVNTYTRSTTVTQGDLNIAGSITGSNVVVTPTGTNTAILASGATSTTSTIAPTASSGNAVVIGGGGAGSSAILAPGDQGTIGTINFTLQTGAHFNFAANSIFAFDIGSASSDLLSFTAAPVSGEWLTGAGNATLQLSGTIIYTDSYTLVQNAIANGGTGAFTFANITGYNTASFQANVTQSGDNYVLSFSQLSVPEPSPVLSVLCGVGILGFVGRFRRRLWIKALFSKCASFEWGMWNAPSFP